MKLTPTELSTRLCTERQLKHVDPRKVIATVNRSQLDSVALERSIMRRASEPWNKGGQA